MKQTLHSLITVCFFPFTVEYDGVEIFGSVNSIYIYIDYDLKGGKGDFFYSIWDSGRVVTQRKRVKE